MIKMTCRFPREQINALDRFANPGESQAETLRRAVEKATGTYRNLDPIESGDARFKCFNRSTVDVPADLLAEAQHLLDGGQKISAIKMIRMKLGLELADAVGIVNCLDGGKGPYVAQRLN